MIGAGSSLARRPSHMQVAGTSPLQTNLLTLDNSIDHSSGIPSMKSLKDPNFQPELKYQNRKP